MSNSAALFLFFAWDKRTAEDRLYLDAANEGIQCLEQYLGLPIRVHALGPTWNSGKWNSVEDYLSECRQSNGQINLTRLTDRLQSTSLNVEHPYQDLWILSEDATAEGLNWAFGVSAGTANVQSTYRLSQYVGSPEVAYAMFRWIIFHELGHAVGLVPRNATNYDWSQADTYPGHCSISGCSMSYIESLNHLQNQVFVADNWLPCLCPYCQDILVNS